MSSNKVSRCNEERKAKSQGPKRASVEASGAAVSATQVGNRDANDCVCDGVSLAEGIMVRCVGGRRPDRG